MPEPTPFTERRFIKGDVDYSLPLLVQGIILPGDTVRWRIEIDEGYLVWPEERGPLDGKYLIEVLEKVIGVIKEEEGLDG